MIDATHALAMVRQCQILGLSRSSVYYRPAGPSEETLSLMQRIDELHLEYPYYGSRKLVAVLGREGIQIGRRQMQTLMRELGIEALYQKPNLSRPEKAHKKWPYLLRDLDINRPGQV